MDQDISKRSKWRSSVNALASWQVSSAGLDVCSSHRVLTQPKTASIPPKALESSRKSAQRHSNRVYFGILLCNLCIILLCIRLETTMQNMYVYIYILRYIKICQDTIECDCISILVDCRRHCNSWGYPDHRSWPHGIVASLWPSLGCVPGDHRHAWNNVECRASNQPGPR
jgi:hypothetical protein